MFQFPFKNRAGKPQGFVGFTGVFNDLLQDKGGIAYATSEAEKRTHQSEVSEGDKVEADVRKEEEVENLPEPKVG